MTEAEILGAAEAYLEAYRVILKLDPVYRFTVRNGGTTMSRCEKDTKSPLSWILHLDAAAHSDVSDVKYSVVEFLLQVQLADLDFIKDDLVSEIRSRVATRLTLAIEPLLPDFDGEEQDEQGN